MEFPEELPAINYLGFNQDQTCLAVGTIAGFRIFSTESFTLLHKEDCGAVSVVEMLFRTSLLALVGFSSSRTPSSSSRKLTMWNTKDRCNICSLQFETKIFSVKMNHRRVVVLLQQKIQIFDLKSMRCLHVIDRPASTWADAALGWLCAASERGYLATPLALAAAAAAPGAGQATLWSPVPQRGLGSQQPSNGDSGAGASGGDDVGVISVVDTYTLKPVGTVLAHRAPVQALCLNPSGQLLATASTKGTVVRLFAVPSLEMVFSFRRGTSSCRIFALLFSRDSGHLCASSASGTVHIFKNSDKVLAGLPLQSEAATIGAAHRDLAVQVQGGGGYVGNGVEAGRRPSEGLPAGLLMLGPRGGGAESDAGGAAAATAADGDEAGAVAAAAATAWGDREFDVEDLGEWNVVEESPDRLLEMSMNGPSYTSGGSSGSRQKNALQTLSELSEHAVENLPRYAEIAVENSAKYAKQLLAMLPQPCRELVDAPRAFAWVHLRGRDSDEPGAVGGITGGGGSMASGGAAAVGAALQGLHNLGANGFGGGLPEHGGFISCVNLHPRESPGRAEVLVATVHGCAHVYAWSPSAGGECRLRTEHSFMGAALDDRPGPVGNPASSA
eukprot:CAMPEP_0177481398 /NCGR_PEP_ID=MMETSP0369-20130122/26361_1 /TAXON_ID=447022 ORGANISM="Scrippsiella hangoei-like, Strain SHHI-4" /NCGR_SAMPLE_ID=MMETSP0369 /ASSEMBLY_ACC=CAM_ASM_000364 /LENGTH=613 /DNA_ID=CAMNT_0018957217 /DNA_START=77 /DNA_END=1915 /DNA_ORIENTATION=-